MIRPKHKDIVAFVKALNQTLDVFTNKPETVQLDESLSGCGHGFLPVVKAVWPDHKWSGRWGPDMLDFLVARTSGLRAGKKIDDQPSSKEETGKVPGH